MEVARAERSKRRIHVGMGSDKSMQCRTRKGGGKGGGRQTESGAVTKQARIHQGRARGGKSASVSGRPEKPASWRLTPTITASVHIKHGGEQGDGAHHHEAAVLLPARGRPRGHFVRGKCGWSAPHGSRYLA